MKRVIKESVLSSKNSNPKNATFKTDRRLSPTSERYKGYLIVLDRGGDGYNVYDKHRELEDAGYPSREAAKQFIDELENPKNVISSIYFDEFDESDDDYDDLIINKTYITLSDYYYDTVSNLHEADWDEVIDVFESNNWISRDDLIIPKGTKMTLSDVDNYYNIFEVHTSHGTSYIPIRLDECDGLFREVSDEEIYSSESSPFDNSEKEFQRISRSGTDEEVEATSATNSEYALFKNTYSHLREFEDQDKQSGNIRDLIDELENKGISYDIYYNKTNNGCTIFYDDDGTVTAASYGGAFDIEDDQFFTKEEIVEFGNTVCDHLNETLHDTYDVSDVYMETPKKLVLTIVQKSDESEFTATIGIDMRKIKKPADLMNRYLGDAVYALQQDIKAYNDEINASSDITSAQKTGVDEIKTKIWNAASAKMEDMGFPVDEIPDYLFVEVKQADDHIRVEVRAELTYNGLTKLTNELDPIVQSFDKDSYFEPVEPGIAQAYIWNLSNINSSETVEAGIYDVPDRPLDPPEDDSWEELDADDEVIEVTLDAIVHIDENGNWEYEDTNYPWAASPDDTDGDWYTDKYNIYIGNKISIVEYVDELLVPMMPAKEGKYHIKGEVTLVFAVKGIEVKRDYFGDDLHGPAYDEETYADDAETSFLYDKSYIKNFKITER